MLQNTLKNIRARRDGEEGFTLIELMVVVLIIAILIAIAIPTFLGASNRAKDKSAQSSARNALSNAKTVFTDSQDYTQATPAALATEEPSLQFCRAGLVGASDCNGADSVGPKGVVVNPVSASVIQIVARSKSGTCFAVQDDTAGGGTTFAKYADAAGKCTVGGLAGAAWNSTW